MFMRKILVESVVGIAGQFFALAQNQNAVWFSLIELSAANLNLNSPCHH